MATSEQPKKPAGGAFGRFMAEKRSEFAAQCKGQPVSAVSKLGGEEWKKLSEAQKAPYQKLFEEAQKKYKEDMEAFLAAGGVKTKGAAALRTEKRKAKEMKKTKDPNKPKKPAGGAYGCFMAANRAAFQKESPGSVAGVAKLAGAKWKALSEAEKAPYEKDYQEKLVAYKEAMKSYVPPAGAGQEDEGEDEDDDDDAEEKGTSPPAKKAKTSPPAKKAKTAPAPVADKAGRGGGRGRGRGRGAAKTPAASPEVALPKMVQDKADAKGFTVTLKKLLGRDDIKAGNITAQKALDALDASDGLLHAARRALLGA